ncbi:MAG: creatininase family protein [Salinibacterium sp.]|nr:creatininase family protein [Salinibacterium sp.]
MASTLTADSIVVVPIVVVPAVGVPIVGGPIVVVPTGAIEHHGPRLPLATDALMRTLVDIGRSAAITPPQGPYSMLFGHAAFAFSATSRLISSAWDDAISGALPAGNATVFH